MMEDGMRRLLAHVGLLQETPPASGADTTRLTQVGGDDHYVYASEPGLFEPLVEIGEQLRGRLGPHDGSRVAVEGDDDAAATDLGCLAAYLGDDRLVTPMHAVVRADGDDAAERALEWR
jgi:hypothetical protein